MCYHQWFLFLIKQWNISSVFTDQHCKRLWNVNLKDTQIKQGKKIKSIKKITKFLVIFFLQMNNRNIRWWLLNINFQNIFAYTRPIWEFDRVRKKKLVQKPITVFFIL